MGFPPKGWRELYLRISSCQLRCSTNLFVFGQCGDRWHIFDASLKNPPMLDIKSGKFDVEGAGDLKLYFDLLKISHKDAWKAWKKTQAANKPAKTPAKAGPMTDSDFKLVEDKLSIKLPAVYRKIVTEIPAELLEWPPAPGETANQPLQDFLLDANEIVKAQKAARKRLGHALPPHSFVFGRSGDNYWLIDISKKDPEVDLVIEGMTLSGPKSLAEHLERIKSNHKEAWAKVRKRTEAGAKATMSPEKLVSEVRRLARPAVLLVDKGKDYAAIWKGTGVVAPPPGTWEHWISIDTAKLPENPRKLRGVLSVYLCLESGERYEQVGVVHDPKATLPLKTDGTKLFARPYDCPPPMEALFKFGGPAVQDWLAAHSVDPNHGINPSAFPDRAPLKAAHEIVDREHPFFGKVDCYAMLGGWSMCFMWCYGIDEQYPWDLLKGALTVLTLRDSEPWLEVFDDGKEFVTFSRIT
jgi:hypothetical protein